MHINDKRDISDFDREIEKYLGYFELPGMQLSLKGSAQYKFLMYKSDYDVLIQVRKDKPVAEIFNNLKKSLEKIEQDPNTYFIELKLQSNDGKKIRFHHGDTFSFSDFEKAFGDIAFFKVDMVINVKNKFYEASCVYNVSSNETLTVDQVAKHIKEDIEKYLAEGKYWKVLKRWFSIYILYNNVESIEFLVRVFNSELGKLYEKVCNLQAIELLHEFYKDDRTMEKINQNLKLVGEDSFNIKTMNRKLSDYLKLLNNEAKKIYKGLKDEVRFP